VAGLRGQADVIIVLSNLSIQENEALASKVPGIDVIVGTHDAQSKPGSRAVAGPEGQVVIAVTYRQGQFLGQLTVRFDSAGHVVSFTGQDLVLTDKYADDPAMVELLGQYGVKP
jgi:2',3'-cyclic-nucleotide 2'-phosphodiesterase (5'-nucleotidase family)